MGLVEEVLGLPEPGFDVGLFGLLPVWAPGSDLLLVLLGVPEVLALEDRSKIPSVGFLPDEEEGTEQGSFPAGLVTDSDSYISSVSYRTSHLHQDLGSSKMTCFLSY